MKFNLTKQNGVRLLSSWAGLLVAGGLSSCKLAEPERYAQADWSVKTTVTKEDFPIGVDLEEVSDAPMPTPEEIAAGLPNHQGAGVANVGWNLKTDADGHVTRIPMEGNGPELPVESFNTSEPPMPGMESGNTAKHSVRDSLVAGGPEPTLPTPGQPKVEEIRPAQVEKTPENLALIAAQSVRPYMPPRGVSNVAPEAQPPAPVAPVASAAAPEPSPAASAPDSNDLVEILQLAKKVESNRKR